MKKSTARRNRGFTLIEVLLVLVILVVLASLAVVAYGPIQKRMREDAAKTQIGLLEQAVETYQTEIGTYPASFEDLRRDPGNLTPGKWHTFLNKDVPPDPWNKQYEYKCPGDHNPESFDVWTVTPENKVIGNWTEERMK